MAQDIVNKNQDISYTNLDFSSIYTEIVDLAKQLSYKWDPSISDESDPGVVLLKLSSLIADKMNYNIDKSVLESFPLSVTQESNARQLYEQLGYYMNWYESATVPINISYIGSDLSDEVVYTIPKFTIITDSESERSYALIGTVDSNGLVVSDGKLAKDGKTIEMIAMEGTPVIFSFLGETNITSQMIDENNRLYFETKYVSQNGIFIRSAGSDQDNYNDWKRVDNLYEQPYNDLRYKFGIDSNSDVAYIEFPDNYAELIGSGIEIVYMVIDPEFSNIPTKTLDRFLNPLIPVEDSNVALGTDNTKIENIYSASGHKDVETIDEAYVNYKRTVGTFKTLITLRDYLNFILSEGEELCSNGFVTDRTNDPQLSYKVMSNVNGVDTLITEIESDDEYVYTKVSDANYEPNKYYRFINRLIGFRLIRGESYDPNISAYYIKRSKEKLTPFSLKFYLLQDAVAVNTKENFEQTFEMIQSEDLPSIDAFIENTSHIQHTYEDILPLGENTYKRTEDEQRSDTKSYYKKIGDRYEFISSSYHEKVDSSHYFYYKDEGVYIHEDKIEDLQTYYVVSATKTNDTEFDSDKNYYEFKQNKYEKTQDSSFVEGKTYYELEETTPYKYNSQYGYYYTIKVEDITANDDVYILVSVSDDDNISPFDAEWYEIDVEALSPHVAYFRAKYPINMAITTYSVVGKDVQTSIKTNVLNALYENLNSTQLEFGDRIELDYLTEVVLNADTRIKTVVFDNIDYRIEAIYYDKIRGFIGITLPVEISAPKYNDEDSVLSYTIAKDIYAKSVLAGVTKLLDEDDEFEYNLNQSFISKYDDLYSISSEATIDFKNISGKSSRNYTLKENEIVTIFQPKLTNNKTYETGVHYEYLIQSSVIENSSYRLSRGEYFITYVSETDENNEITGYTTTVYTNGAIIKPSFSLEVQPKYSALSSYFKTQLFPQVTNSVNSDSTEMEFSISGSGFTNDYWLTSIQNDSSINNNVITGSDSVIIQSMSEITIEPSDGYKFYWQLNNIETAQSTGRKFYRLFNSYNPETDKRDNGTINSYTLKSGETLYYMNNAGTQMAVLNEGTTITRNGGLDSSYETVPSENLISYLPVTETASGETVLRSGINLIQSSEGDYIPTENGLYELNDDEYILSTDSTPHAISGLTGFYVLVMNSANGFYENKGGTYVPTESITYDVFEQVNTENMDVPSIDPSKNNYYEQVTYNNIVIEDTYTAGDTTDVQTNLEGSAISRPRYRKCSSINVLAENIFNIEYQNFVANDVSTYPQEDLTINNNTAGIFSPSYNNLYEVDVPTEYTEDGFYKFYTFNAVAEQDLDLMADYTRTTDDTPQEGTTYYTFYSNDGNYYPLLQGEGFKVYYEQTYEAIDPQPYVFGEDEEYYIKNGNDYVEATVYKEGITYYTKNINNMYSEANPQPTKSFEQDKIYYELNYPLIDNVVIENFDDRGYYIKTYTQSDPQPTAYTFGNKIYYHFNEYSNEYEQSESFVADRIYYDLNYIEATEYEEGIDYYQKTGVQTEDETPQSTKIYYEEEYVPTTDIERKSYKTYYEPKYVEMNPQPTGSFDSTKTYYEKNIHSNNYAVTAHETPQSGTTYYELKDGEYVETEESFRIYYIDTKNRFAKDYYELNDGVYRLTTSTTKVDDVTYYEPTEIQPEVNSIPVQEGWYEKTGEFIYQRTNKIYPYKPSSLDKSSASDPFIQIDLNNYDGTGQPIFNGLGCYYKIGSKDTIYKRNTSNNKYIPIPNTDNNLPENLLSICRDIKLSTTSAQDLSIDTLDNNWDDRISIKKPSQMFVKTFSAIESTDCACYFVPAADFNTNIVITQLPNLLTTTSFIYPWVMPHAKTADSQPVTGKTYYVLDSDNNYEAKQPGSLYSFEDNTIYFEGGATKGYVITDDLYQALYPSKPSGSYGVFEDGYDEFNATLYSTDKNTLLNLWYNVANRISSKVGNVILYTIPTYYRIRYLFDTTVDNLYTFKTFVDKTFPEIAPWECEVITDDLVINDPVNALKKVWRTLQDNCSITIRENESYTLTSGDTLTVFTDSLSSNVSWPTLTNTEIILNLDNYNVSYTKSNNEVTSLNKVTIPGADWRAYSNLLINTSVDSGQTIQPNHFISFNDSEEEPIVEIDGSEYHTPPVFQLKYPVNNVSGDNIQVFTYDDLGNIVPNHVYVYKKLIGEDKKVEYSSDGGVVLTFKDLSSGAEVTEINLPFNHNGGEYLIPLYGIDDVELSCEYSYGEYEVTTDTPFNENKHYYEEVYVQTSDTTLQQDKTYYEYSYVQTSDTTPKEGKIYYVKNEQNKYVKINVISFEQGKTYYEHNWYVETTDTSFDSAKTYYEKKEGEYVLTTDKTRRTGKTYYELTTTKIHDFSSETDIFNEEKTYYLYIVIGENDYPKSLIFTIPSQPQEKDIKYVLGDLFKFIPAVDGEIVYNDLLNKVKSLDNNNIFNYTYQPDSNDLIANPLDPKMFWNKNHIYNKNTIAQLDTSSSDNINYRFITSR